MLGAEKRGVQHLPNRRLKLSAASPDLGPQVLLPDGPALEADVVIRPGLEYRTARCRSVDLGATSDTGRATAGSVCVVEVARTASRAGWQVPHRGIGSEELRVAGTSAMRR
jgi:hypothetical protein